MSGGRVLRGAVVGSVIGCVALLATGCSVFGDDEQEGSVFSIEPGECFQAPKDVEAQVSDLEDSDCDEPHDHEAYAVVPYDAADPEASDEYPGDKVLTEFADGACAERFGKYVGVDYPDSELFFTYLLPSARSWQEQDRSVICLVTAAGTKLDGSVKGTKQ